MLDGGAKPVSATLSIELCESVHVACKLSPSRIDGVRSLLKCCRNRKRINSLHLPPSAFITAPMKLAVVQPANWNGELVADLPPHRPLLGKLDVMCIRWASPTNETRL
jgi:hypothetical protein